MSSYVSLFVFFFGLSFLTVGGASATLPEQFNYFVTARHLLSPQQFNELYAIAQASPGPNVMFVAAYGFQALGAIGGMVCLVGICLPSSLIAVGYEAISQIQSSSTWLQVVRKALPSVSVGLVLATAWILGTNAARSHGWLVIVTMLTAYLTARTRIHPLWMIAGGALFGALAVG